MSWQDATRAQYNDDANLAARQALFDWMTAATPLPAPLSDMSVLAGRRVADVGCGNGRFLANATRAGAIAVGSDLSIGMARVARSTAGAPTLQCDAHHQPFATGSIDVVLALWMIYHLDDMAGAVAEFARVLAHDGLLVASTNSGVAGHLDEMVVAALSEQLAMPIDHWHAPLAFTSENGSEILGTAFTDVEVHDFSNTFAVADAAVLVHSVASMLGAIQTEHGDIDTEALLMSVGRSAERQIEQSGSVAIERHGTVFLARR